VRRCLAFVSRCGNDFVVLSEREAITELQSGGQAPHTPPFFLFFFFFFLDAARSGTWIEEVEEKRKSRSNVQDHAALDVHDAVRRREDGTRRRRKQEEDIRRAGLQMAVRKKKKRRARKRRKERMKTTGR
jgi:hypothetical protein